jgi:uncharacterized protein (TIGR03067 family)
MLRISRIAAALSLCLGLLTTNGFAADPDAEKLNGVWRSTSVIENGRPLNEKWIVEVKDGKDKTWINEKYYGSDEYTIDSTKNPKQMDVTYTVNGVKYTCLAIYELDGDKWTYCYADAGFPRPKTFAAPGNGYLVTFKGDPKK